jgi:hypothetical protein
MPYYLFKVSTTDGMALLKKLELIEEFSGFKEAKNSAKQIRTETPAIDGISYKVMFAENLLMAEEQLLEKREKPILMEHEL